MSATLRTRAGLAAAVVLAAAVACGRAAREPAAPAGTAIDTTWRAALDTLPARDRDAVAAAHREVARAQPLAAVPARAALERGLAAARDSLGGAHPAVAVLLSALARHAASQGDLGRAHELDTEALAIRRRTLGPGHPDVAESLAQLAIDLKNAGGSWREAMRLHREALGIRVRTLGRDARATLDSRMAVANMHRLTNHPDSAAAEFADVLGRRRRAVPPDPDGVASTLTAWALVHTQASEWAYAEPRLAEAVAIRRALDPPNPAGLEMSLSTWGMTLRELGRFDAAESVLTECAALREALRRASEPGRGRAAMFDLSVHWQLAAAQLARGRGDDAWASVERGASRTLLESLAARGLVDTAGWGRRALPELQHALAPDEAAIGWLELKRGAGREGWPLWCWCVRRNGPVRWRRVDGPPGDMWHGSSDAVYALRGELDAAANWPLRIDDTTAVARDGAELYRVRLAPLAADLAGVRRLVVVSPTAVRGVPLEALPDPAGGWLADRYTIEYAPSALLVARRRAPPARPARAWRALLVGDPAYGAAAAWPPLDAAGAEVAAIANALPHATRLDGVLASEAALRGLVRSGALTRYDLLHFATHVAVDDRFPGRSAFVLAEAGGATAPAPDAGAAPDGFVTVDDVAATWSLDARLVSLAGCRSALGWVSHAEGFIGFEQAVLGAGARSVLLGLWRVDDRATALLMQRFYAALLRPGATPVRAAAALAEARRAVRDFRAPDGTRPYRHPVYWAGVVLVGDPG